VSELRNELERIFSEREGEAASVAAIAENPCAYRTSHELEELEDGFKHWNTRVQDEGLLVPDIAKI